MLWHYFLRLGLGLGHIAVVTPASYACMWSATNFNCVQLKHTQKRHWVQKQKCLLFLLQRECKTAEMCKMTSNRLEIWCVRRHLSQLVANQSVEEESEHFYFFHQFLIFCEFFCNKYQINTNFSPNCLH